MDFADAAAYFNNDQVVDGYTGAPLFFCRTSAHDDKTSSGATARRRTLTAAPDVTPPARGVVALYGEHWILSDSNTDNMMGAAVRRSFGMKKATGLMTLLTPAQACAGAAGINFYAHKDFYRDVQDARTQSEWDVMWNVFSAMNEPIAKGSFLRQDGTLYRVRNTYPSVERYRVAEADEFDADAAQEAVFVRSGKVDLVTDIAEEVSTTLQVIQTDSMKFYRYRTEVEADSKPGDRVVFLPAASYAPLPGAVFTMLGARWRVLSGVIDGDARVLRARLA